MGLSLERAQRVLQRALEAAIAQNVNVAVAVVDLNGGIVAAARMDGVGFMSLPVAEKKARVAANFGFSTQVAADIASKDPLIHAAFAGDPNVITLPGGVPITDGEKHVGAIGVAGGHYAQDQAVAAYAVS